MAYDFFSCVMKNDHKSQILRGGHGRSRGGHGRSRGGNGRSCFLASPRIALKGMTRQLVSREFSSSTLMDGLLLTKAEPGLDLPDDDDALAKELEELQE